MTRTKRVVAVALLMLMLSALAFAGMASADDDDNKREPASFTLVASPSTTDAPGGFTWTAELETTKGLPVGWQGGQCVELQLELDRYLCDMVVRLPEGDLTAAALVEMDAATDWLYAVTGGTGKFHKARGEIEEAVLSEDPFLVSMTFRLENARANY